jgi:quinol monooxygenase YgiN
MNQTMPTNGLVIVAHFRALPGKEDALEQLLMGLVGPTRSEHGCVLYDLHRDLQDPAQFLFYEIWTDRESWDAHMVTPHLEELKATVGDYLAEPLRVWQMRQIEP